MLMSVIGNDIIYKNVTGVVTVARMMYLLDPSSQDSAVSLATALDAELEKVDLQVVISWLPNIKQN
jgi:hypothetical protein